MSESKFKFFHLFLALGAVLALNSSLAFAEDDSESELYIRKGTISGRILEESGDKYSVKKIPYSFEQRDNYVVDYGQIVLDCALQSFGDFNAEEQSILFSKINKIQVVEYKPGFIGKLFSSKARAEYGKITHTLKIEFMPNYATFQKPDVCAQGALPELTKTLHSLIKVSKKREVDEGDKAVSSKDSEKPKVDRDALLRARDRMDKASEAELLKTMDEVLAPLPIGVTQCDRK
ncbi:hypothetical protein WDW86_13375 [Bdellovibrionota bacterium FG-2]